MGEAVATRPCPWSRAFVGAEVASSFVLWMTEPCRHQFRAPRFVPPGNVGPMALHEAGLRRGPSFAARLRPNGTGR